MHSQGLGHERDTCRYENSSKGKAVKLVEHMSFDRISKSVPTVREELPELMREGCERLTVTQRRTGQYQRAKLPRSGMRWLTSLWACPRFSLATICCAIPHSSYNCHTGNKCFSIFGLEQNRPFGILFDRSDRISCQNAAFQLSKWLASPKL